MAVCAEVKRQRPHRTWLGWTLAATALCTGAVAHADAPAKHPPVHAPLPTDLREAAHDAAAKGQRWVLVRHRSQLLSRNAEGRQGDVTLAIALPVEATACLARPAMCPIQVFLPGFGAAPHAYGPADNPLMQTIDAAMADGRLPPLLTVVVDGRTRLGGGCYVDSATTGPWQEFLVAELPALLQAAFGRRQLVLTGHSMGGYGTLAAVLAAPSVYRGAVAISPLLRARVVHERLMPVVRKAATQHGPRDVAVMLQNPKSLTFSEKLLWALLAAWAPRPQLLAGVPPLASDATGLPILDPVTVTAVNAADLVQRLAALPRERLASVGRIFLGLGSRDGLTRHEDAEALRQAWLHAGGPPQALLLRLHDGNHASEMPNDLVAGLQFVLRPEAHPRHP